MATKDEIRRRKLRMEKLRRQKLRRRRRRMRIAAIIIAAIVLIVVLVLILNRPAADGPNSVVNEIPAPTVQITAEPTPEPTPTLTPEPTPEPTPEVYIPVNLYIPDGSGVRHKLSEFEGPWKKGKDIDCFEALVSDADTLQGKNFYSICKEAWGTLPDPYAMKIGYTLRYTLTDGSEISMQILSPKDISHTEYVECYLYDDVHQDGGFYTHLSESGMKDNTLITSIKLTCGKQIDQVQDMHLGVFLYDSQQQFDAQSKYTGYWKSEIEIRREA